MDATDLRRAKERLGWSAQRLARELRVSERTSWRYLSGESPIPGPVHSFIEVKLLELPPAGYREGAPAS